MIPLIFLVPFLFVSSLWSQETIKIGSKRFTESYILGEILKETAQEAKEANVDYRQGLGNTGIVFEALREGSIDIYPEYTGTIIQEFLKLPMSPKIDLSTLRSKLNSLDLDAGIPLGFSNSYALAMRKDEAIRLNIHSISDLSQHPDLKLGLSQEFINRSDGWEALKKNYLLNQQNIIGIDHSLTYSALANRQIDLTDVYTTDPKIKEYNLQVLDDDRHFFPIYDAILLYRKELPQKFPKTWKAFKSLKNSISNEEMLTMNARAEFTGESFVSIAGEFLPTKHIDRDLNNHRLSFLDQLFAPNLWTLTLQHLFLVFGSLIPAIFIGIFMGILASYSAFIRVIILNSVSIVQTIPSLALLAFMIPILQQIGTLPALIALFLYALLPIVRNTYTGLSDISKPLKESAIVLGLKTVPSLFLVELPLASRSILAGIKTAAVINVGMATIAALIGAGGYGERILTGLALNNYEILLAGAIPACILALLVQWGFDLLEYCIVPKGLRIK